MQSKIDNARITFVILVMVITVAGIAFTPVFAQYTGGPAILNYTGANQATTGNTGGITVTTDKTSYNDGDTITISGSTQNYISNTPITVIITSPIGNIVIINTVNLGSDRTFSTSTMATGAPWQAAGTYAIKAQYGSSSETAQTTFQFSGSVPNQSGNTIPVDGTNFSIQYEITNGKILGITSDMQSKSLTISTQTSGNGVLTVTLPRALINATLTNGQDDKYNVLVDGQEDNFQEIDTTTTDRTLSIPFIDGTQEIKIIGTSFVGNEIFPTPTQHSPYLTCPDCNDTSNIQQIPPIAVTVTTDKPVYDHNSQIMITAHVANPYPGQDVHVEITSPSGNVVSVDQLTVDSNGDFVAKVSTVGNIWAENGPYRIAVQQGDEQARVSSTYFELSGEGPIIAPFVISVSTDKPTYNFGDMISISGSVAEQLNIPISVIIKDPLQHAVYITQATPGSDNTYSTQVTAGGDLWASTGTYEVDVNYGGKGTAVRVFQFAGNRLPTTIPPAPPIIPPVTPPTSSSPNEIDMAKGAGASALAGCVSTKNCFYPNPLSVIPGTTVTWKNTDDVQHYVTSGLSTDNTTGTVFDSGNLIKIGGTYQFTFYNSGTYNYFCTVHPWMMGQVIVGNGEPAYTLPNPTPSPIFTPTQQDIQNINQAKDNQTIAAEVNVGTNQSETQSIDSNVSVQTTQNTPDSLGVQVSATNQTGPKVIAFNLAATTINVANLKDLGIMYDGKLIAPAPNMDAILHAKPTDNPSFAIVVTQSGVQVLVLVPHFSTHTITITNMSKVIPTVPEFPFSSLMLIIAILPIILISRTKLD